MRRHFTPCQADCGKRSKDAAASLLRLAIILFVVAGICVPVRAGESPRFIGHVTVEWLDDPFVPKIKLLADFGFADGSGRIWLARNGHTLDEGALPPVARTVIGSPLAGEFRRAYVVYEYYTHIRTEPWPAVHRMLFNSSRVEGMEEIDAKILYAVAYAAGSRWEIKESSLCFSSCHKAAAELSWRPAVSDADLRQWADWARRTNPTLDEIDEFLNAAIKRPGPHLFVQR